MPVPYAYVGRKIGRAMMRKVISKQKHQEPQSRMKSMDNFTLLVVDSDVQEALLVLMFFLSMDMISFEFKLL